MGDDRKEVERKMPGQDVKIGLQASSDSLCALGLVDKSVHFLGGKDQLSKDKVFEGLEKIDNFDRYEYNYPGEDEYCDAVIAQRHKEEKEGRERAKNSTASRN